MLRNEVIPLDYKRSALTSGQFDIKLYNSHYEKSTLNQNGILIE